jgi:hypothetical protein
MGKIGVVMPDIKLVCNFGPCLEIFVKIGAAGA